MFDRFRSVLTDGDVDTRTKYLIEGLFAIRKQRFPNNPAVPPELDLVETEDQITHEVCLFVCLCLWVGVGGCGWVDVCLWVD